MARPYTFTDDIANRVISMTTDGASQKDCAKAIGVRRGTVIRWLREGRNGHPKFARFANEYDAAVGNRITQ